MKIWINLISEKAAEYDFFRYCKPVNDPLRIMRIRFKFRSIILTLINKIRAGEPINELKTIGILQHLSLQRKQKEVEFDEFKRSAGTIEDDNELIQKVLLPLPLLIQQREQGMHWKYFSLQENVKNPIFLKLLEEAEIEKIYGKKKEDEYTKKKWKKAQQLPQPYTEVDFVL